MAVVNVTLITNGDKRVDKVSDSMTLREIYDKYGVNYQHCTNTVNSEPVGIRDLDMSLHDLKVGENVRMSSIVKADNAAKVFVGGSVAVVKSGYKLEDWKRALKYDSDLGVYDENDNAIFRAFVSKGLGSLTKNGVEFSDVADDDGYATVTILLDPSDENKKEVVKDRLGPALVYLNQVEEGLRDVLKDADKYDKEIDEMVETI